MYFCSDENKPCFTCSGCKKVFQLLHPDIHIVTPEKNILRVDQVRQVLSTLYESAYEGGSKIYIFEDFHLANEQAQNALLKNLEEPPKSVVFFLLCENSLKLLPTIRSRCKKIRLCEFREEDILKQLKKSFPDNEKNVRAAKECFGNIGTAVRLVQDEEYNLLNLLATDILSNSGLTYAHISMIFEKEKDNFLLLAEILENKLFERFRQTQSQDDLIKIKAVQDALTAKRKNINSSLIFDRLAYTLAKGGNIWHR